MHTSYKNKILPASCKREAKTALFHAFFEFYRHLPPSCKRELIFQGGIKFCRFLILPPSCKRRLISDDFCAMTDRSHPRLNKFVIVMTFIFKENFLHERRVQVISGFVHLNHEIKVFDEIKDEGKRVFDVHCLTRL